MEAIERRLRVMDSTALALCMENGMPINVFNMDDETNIARIISGRARGHARELMNGPRPCTSGWADPAGGADDER